MLLATWLYWRLCHKNCTYQLIKYIYIPNTWQWAPLCSLRIMELMLTYIDITGFWRPHLLQGCCRPENTGFVQGFHLVAGLETPCNNLEIIKVISSGYMASAFKVPYLDIAVCRSCGLVILLTHLEECNTQYDFYHKLMCFMLFLYCD